MTSSLSAATAAKKLFEEYFMQYGWPTKLITDQVGTFESKLFKSLMQEADVKKIRTTPYRPQGNAQCERFNQTLIGMLGTMPVDSKKEWQEWVSAMTHAYNCTVSKTTGYSPYFFRWFKFTLKPPNSIASEKLRLAIWDTSFWTFWVKFGHNGP